MHWCNSFILILAFLWIQGASCSRTGREHQSETWKREIVETERQFAAMAATEGIEAAFLAYADEKAVLMRNNELIEGRSRIGDYFRDQPSSFRQAKLAWSPDFVDVARSGDLGYTYGRYLFTFTDSTGKQMEQTGIFHTVWKRQEDGSWRFVWD